MNIKYSKLTLVVLAFGAVLFMSNRGGSPGGKSGSTTDGSTCVTGGCHGSSSSNVVSQEMISIDIPESGYAASATYTITVNSMMEGVSVWGFEMMAEDGAGNGVGTFANSDNVNVKDNGLRATHKFASSSSADEQTWTVNWTAPATGTGDVRFFAATLAANGNGKTSGDDILIDTLVISENPTASIEQLAQIELDLYPNPVTRTINIRGYNNAEASVSVFNIRGMEVLSMPFTNKVDVSELPSGAYHLKISDGRLAVTEKFIVK